MNVRRFLELAVQWVFRKRSPALIAMRIGFGCLALAYAADILFDVSLPWSGGTFRFRFDGTSGPPAAIVAGTALLGCALIVVGAAWEISRNWSEYSEAKRRKVIVIEGRGLRDTAGAPLKSAVPASLVGQRYEHLIDLRQRIKDGVVTDPEAALADLVTLPKEIRRQSDGIDRNDISIVYGGLTPVPFTFLTGVLLDDEGPITVLDWHRHTEQWRALDASDDGKRFQPANLLGLDPAQKEVALLASVSYVINPADVTASLGNMPIIDIKLEDGNPDAHWSEAKQQALGQQFLQTVVELSNRGTERLHIFLACQNGLAFRLGRLYDKRNLPKVIVYQFQRAASSPYPWGILMPVAGIETPQIIRTR